MENNFIKLAAIDVGQHIERKANLSYLSWAWAVDQLMRVDPAANWEFHEPKMFGDSMMVSCTVTAFGKPVTMHLPVMDHRNKAIHNPDAFDVNKNMMRCLVKAIACHGLGLYIYAGEDLPLGEPVVAKMPESVLVDWISYITDSASTGELRARLAEAENGAAADPEALAKIREAAATKKAQAVKVPS